MTDHVETIKKERQRLAQGFRENSLHKDRVVVSVSGVALGLSLTVLKDIAKDPAGTWALYVALAGFGLSLTLVLISFVLNSRQIFRSINNIDVWLDDKERTGRPKDGAFFWNVWKREVRVVSVLGDASVYSLIVGVAFVIAFVWLNV